MSCPSTVTPASDSTFSRQPVSVAAMNRIAVTEMRFFISIVILRKSLVLDFPAQELRMTALGLTGPLRRPDHKFVILVVAAPLS